MKKVILFSFLLVGVSHSNWLNDAKNWIEQKYNNSKEWLKKVLENKNINNITQKTINYIKNNKWKLALGLVGSLLAYKYFNQDDKENIKLDSNNSDGFKKSFIVDEEKIDDSLISLISQKDINKYLIQRLKSVSLFALMVEKTKMIEGKKELKDFVAGKEKSQKFINISFNRFPAKTYIQNNGNSDDIKTTVFTKKGFANDLDNLNNRIREVITQNEDSINRYFDFIIKFIDDEIQRRAQAEE